MKKIFYYIIIILVSTIFVVSSIAYFVLKQDRNKIEKIREQAYLSEDEQTVQVVKNNLLYLSNYYNIHHLYPPTNDLQKKITQNIQYYRGDPTNTFVLMYELTEKRDFEIGKCEAQASHIILTSRWEQCYVDEKNL